MSVSANTITFSTDSSLYYALHEREDKKPNLYHIAADELYISRISIWPLLLGKGIQVPEIVLRQPQLSIHSYQQNNTGKKNKKPVLLHLHQYLGNYIPWVTVDSVKVQNGQLQHVLQNDSASTEWQMKNFSLLFADVLVDKNAEEDTTRIFYTKNIELETQEGIALISNPYSFTTGPLRISTAGKTELQNVTLTTDTTQTNAAHTRLFLRIPAVYAGFLDWRKMLDRKGLYISAIHSIKPEAEITLYHQQDRQQKEQTWTLLHKKVSQLAPWLKIDSIQLHKGDVTLKMVSDSGRKQLVIEKFDLTLDDIFIAPEAAHDPERILYTKHINVTVHDFVQAESELYTVKATLLNLSTRNGFHIEGLTVETDKQLLKQHPEATIYALTVPSLDANFTGWRALTTNKGLHIPLIQVNQPEARIVVRQQNRSGGNLPSLHKMLPSHIPWLQVDQVRVENGSITYVQAGSRPQSTFSLNNLVLTGHDILVSAAAANDSGRFLYTKDISLEIKDYAKIIQKRHHLKIGYVSASTSKGITLQHIQVRKDSSQSHADSSLYYQLQVSLIHTDFTDWNALLEKKGVQASLLQIKKPEVLIHFPSTNSPLGSLQKQQYFPQQNLLTLHQEISPYIPWLRIDTIRLTEGEARLVQEDSTGKTIYTVPAINITMDDLLVDSAAASDSNRLFYSRNIHLQVNDSLHITTPEYTFAVDSLTISTTDGIQLAGMHLFPQPEVLAGERTKAFFDLRVPGFSSGFTDWGNFMQAANVHVPDSN